MIEKVEWDSWFFKRNIGELKKIPSEGAKLRALLSRAKKQGFSYIRCRINAADLKKVQLLEKYGFYICDIGVTWKMDLANRAIPVQKGVKLANSSDSAELKRMAKGLFRDSRFYKDPFYTKAEADALYIAWVENSLIGDAADAVFFVKQLGFVTCKKTGKKNGVIPLIGVVPEKRKSGVGHKLVFKALQWFRAQGIETVKVRTQAYNTAAMNFYGRSGFSIDSGDITMAIILRKGE